LSGERLSFVLVEDDVSYRFEGDVRGAEQHADVDGIRELRSLLKRLLRGGGFRAVSIREARRDD
jgi:hypothetical protein